MKCIPYFMILAAPLFAKGQYGSSRETDQFAGDINKNIFRVIASYYDDDWTLLTFCYEREIKRPFTVSLKTGPCFNFGLGAFQNSDQKWSMNAFASAELRYYYNLRRKIKKKKTVRNYSGLYLALEESVISGPIIVVNKPRRDALDGSAGTFINIGYQKQFKQSYFNIFLGAAMDTKALPMRIVSATTYHYGLGAGILLFE